MLHGFRFHVEPAYRDLLAEAGIRSHDDLVRAARAGGGREERSVSRFELPGTPARREFYVKWYRYAGWRILRTFLYKAKAEREFENLRAVAAAGAPTVRPAAYGVRRRWGFIPSSFLVTEAADGAVNARALIAAYVAGRPAEAPLAAFRGVLDRVADDLRMLHAQGIYLHTAFEKNLLIRARGGEAEYCWVDLPFAGRTAPGCLPMRRRVRDVACLNKGLAPVLSASARLRLLRRYAGADADRGRFKALARAAVRYTQALRDETFASRLVNALKGRS